MLNPSHYRMVFLIFDIQGLIPGNTFLLTRKKVLDDNFTNYWVPQWSFVATSTNQIVTVPFPNDSDTGFYLVVDYDLYQGPSPTINSPADNSTASGTIQVISALTDIFLATQAELFIDEKSFGTVTNGHAGWNVDTALLPNGYYTVDVRFLSQIPIIDNNGSNNVALWYSDAMLYNLNTSNFLAENVAPRGFTAEFGTVPFAFDTATSAVVNVKVFDATGTNLVWNTSVTNHAAGTCYPYWNLLDNAGNPVSLPSSGETVTYNVVVNAAPFVPSPGPSPGPDASSERDFSVHISTDPHAGRTAVFRNQYVASAPYGINDNQDDLLSGTIGAVWGAYPIHPFDMDGWERNMDSQATPRVFVVSSDFPYFYTVLTNQMTGQFLYICDAGGSSFGTGKDNTAAYVFSASTVAEQLGNSLQLDGPYGHRVRMAAIEGCTSATGNLNLAFGSPDGLDRNPAMSKSSFVGWATDIFYSGTWSANTPYEQQMKYWHLYWTYGGFFGGPGIQRANEQCLNDYNASLDIKIARRVKGSKAMTWIKTD